MSIAKRPGPAVRPRGRPRNVTPFCTVSYIARLIGERDSEATLFDGSCSVKCR
jgi:hypothetical protein